MLKVNTTTSKLIVTLCLACLSTPALRRGSPGNCIVMSPSR